MRRSGRKLLRLALAGLAFLCPPFFPGLLAQTKTIFTAQLDQTRITVGENVVLTVDLQGEDIDLSRGVELPDLRPYFQLEGQVGPSVRTEMSLINGAMTKRVSWRMQYDLVALKSGKFTIPRLVHQSGNQIYHTNPISVEIVEPQTLGEQPGASEAKGWAPPSDPFLKLELDRTEYYTGEQIRASWYMYYIEDILNLSMGMPPSLAEFKVLDLENATQLSPTTKDFRGQEWKVAFINSLALFPLRGGKMIIGAEELRFQHQNRRRDFFGMPMVQEFPVKSDPVAVTVKPLPAGAPADFTGAVGAYSLSSRLSKNEVRAGESLNLELEVRGDGNPDYTLEPKLEFPAEFEVYPPEVKSDRDIEAGRLFSIKKFNYVVVARKEGEFQIPGISFRYFDPADGQYRLAQSPTLVLKVTPGADMAEPESGTSGAVSNPEIRADIRFIKPDQKALPDQSMGMFGRAWFWLAHLSGLVLIGFAFWYRSYQGRLSSDQGFARKQRAFAKFKKGLKKTRRLAHEKKYGEFSAGLRHSLLEYLGDRFNQSPWGLLEEDIQEILAKAGAAPEQIKEYLTLLSALAGFSYGGKMESTDDLIGRGEKLVASLEKSLK